MSFVAVGPEAVFSAAKALERVGSELTGAGSAAARTTAVAAAAQDVAALNAGASRYLSAEAANVANVEQMLNAANTPVAALLGHTAMAAAAGVAAASVIRALSLAPAQTVSVFDYATLLGPIRLTPDVMGTAVTAGTLDVATPQRARLRRDQSAPRQPPRAPGRWRRIRLRGAERERGAGCPNLRRDPRQRRQELFTGGRFLMGSTPVPSSTGYSSATYSIPVGGLFGPVSPTVLTLYSTSGSTQTIGLSGTEFGGIFPAIARLFPS